jgi:hypothetical protein
MTSRAPVAHAYNSATQEAGIRRMAVQSQPVLIVLENPPPQSQKHPEQKRAGRVAQTV